MYNSNNHTSAKIKGWEMSTENKPIYVTEFKNQLDSWQVFHAFRSKEHALTDAGSSGRVIECVEIAAVEQLKAENEKAYDALAGNICGYCWQKMEDEPTVKQTHQEYANQLLAENAALKSKLKIASAALEVVKVHNGINAHYPIVYATVTQALRDIGEG